MQGRLEGRVAIVTGASQGIGAAIAERFAAEGAHVALCARREAPLAELLGAIQARGGSASFATLDVADHERLQAFIRDTGAIRGRLDVLVNNAPSVNYGAIEDMSVEAFRRDFAINVDSTFVATREAFRIMLPAQRGSIVNIASIMGLLASPGLSGYGAAKAALIQFTKYAAIEGARSNVRVNAIAPGVINTPLTAAGFSGPAVEYGRKIAAQVPLGRFGEPWEVAAAALFLASDESSYVTGVCLSVDGGRAAELVIPPP
jgi:meso-butanediol dehydrogenase/(S,S)-butanediol dehydrogenase/diacetyl reductase